MSQARSLSPSEHSLKDEYGKSIICGTVSPNFSGLLLQKRSWHNNPLSTHWGSIAFFPAIIRHLIAWNKAHIQTTCRTWVFGHRNYLQAAVCTDFLLRHIIFVRESLSAADRLSNSQCSLCMTRLSGSVCQISCHDLSAGESDQRMGGGVVAGGKRGGKIELLLSSGKVLLRESSFWFLSFERCSLFENNLSTHCNQDHGKHHAWLVPPLNI